MPGNRSMKKKKKKKAARGSMVVVNDDGEQPAASLDFISELSNDILTSVLSHLPLKETARTSILSRRWRNLWTLVPININPGCFCLNSSTDRLCFDMRQRSRYIIRTILSRNSSPIRNFHLDSYDLIHYIATGGCGGGGLKDLTRRGIQHLKLDLKPSPDLPPDLLPCLFACESLETLDVARCRLPAEFPVANNLREVTLRSMAVTRDKISGMLTSAPVLRHLSLLRCHIGGQPFNVAGGHLHIASLSLQSLTIAGTSVLGLVVDDVPNLEFFVLRVHKIMEVVVNAPKCCVF